MMSAFDSHGRSQHHGVRGQADQQPSTGSVFLEAVEDFVAHRLLSRRGGRAGRAGNKQLPSINPPPPSPLPTRSEAVLLGPRATD